MKKLLSLKFVFAIVLFSNGINAEVDLIGGLAGMPDVLIVAAPAVSKIIDVLLPTLEDTISKLEPKITEIEQSHLTDLQVIEKGIEALQIAMPLIGEICKGKEGNNSFVKQLLEIVATFAESVLTPLDKDKGTQLYNIIKETEDKMTPLVDSIDTIQSSLENFRAMLKDLNKQLEGFVKA